MTPRCPRPQGRKASHVCIRRLTVSTRDDLPLYTDEYNDIQQMFGAVDLVELGHVDIQTAKGMLPNVAEEFAQYGVK